MDRTEALGMIADGHAIYKEEASKEILKALGVPWQSTYARPFHSEPDVWKGAEIPPENEGMRGCSALSLGAIVLQHYHLKAEGKLGRGSQGQANAEALEAHFAKEASQ